MTNRISIGAGVGSSELPRRESPSPPSSPKISKGNAPLLRSGVLSAWPCGPLFFGALRSPALGCQAPLLHISVDVLPHLPLVSLRECSCLRPTISHIILKLT